MTKLAKLVDAQGKVAVGRVVDDRVTLLDLRQGGLESLADLLFSPELPILSESLPALGETLPVSEVTFLPPIDRQEVWAAGVTYKRSQTA
ncbi:MAG: 2-hydroxyhepta-2,4-diene-1,7-dioate isomerase, partial [bacterium]|nr:2-hydroxyhepta-2,4-diene-1,7-dioate isomerase [bacterium]